MKSSSVAALLRVPFQIRRGSGQVRKIFSTLELEFEKRGFKMGGLFWSVVSRELLFLLLLSSPPLVLVSACLAAAEKRREEERRRVDWRAAVHL